MHIRIKYDDETQETIECNDWGFNDFGMVMIYDEDEEMPKKVINKNAFLTIETVKISERN